MSTFADTIAAVMARVLVEIPTVTWSVTARDLPAHTAPPNVRWCPDADAYGPAPKRIAATGARAILGADTAFEVICWGADTDATIALRDSVLRSTALDAHGMVAYGPGQWSKGGATDLGEAVTLRITLRGYVPDTAPTLATPTSAAVNDTTDSVTGDGYLDVGET